MMRRAPDKASWKRHYEFVVCCRLAKIHWKGQSLWMKINLWTGIRVGRLDLTVLLGKMRLLEYQGYRDGLGYLLLGLIKAAEIEWTVKGFESAGWAELLGRSKLWNRLRQDR